MASANAELSMFFGGLILTVIVGKEFNDGEESAVLRMLQAVAVPVLGNVCHVFMHGLNRVQVLNISVLGSFLSYIK